LNNFENIKIFIEKNIKIWGISLILPQFFDERRCSGPTSPFIYCGMMEFLADMPSCLGGGDLG
jgi:hypothetical protein